MSGAKRHRLRHGEHTGDRCPTLEDQPPEGDGQPADPQWVFLEAFAKDGRLSRAVASHVVPTLQPQSLLSGGWDLSTPEGLEALKSLCDRVAAGKPMLNVTTGHSVSNNFD